jgi:hypothetical protein
MERYEFNKISPGFLNFVFKCMEVLVKKRQILIKSLSIKITIYGGAAD